MLARTCLSACLLALSLAPVTAQDLDPRISGVAPFISKDTASLLHVDLREMDLKTAADRIKKLAPPGSDAILLQVNLFVPVVSGVRDQLVAAGAPDLYAFAAADPAKPGFAVLPLEAGKDPAAVVEILKGLPGADKAEIIVHNSAVVIGDPGIKDKVAAIEPGRAAEYSYCLKLAGKTNFQFVLLPNAEMFEEALKRAPGSEAAAPLIKEHVDKVRAVVITANLPPKSALAVFVKMKDEAIATEVMGKINEALAGDEAKMAAEHPIFGKLVTAATPKQDKELLKIVLTDTNGGIDALATAVKEGLSMLAPFLQGGLPGAGPPGGLPPGVRPPPGTPGADPFQ